MQEIHFIWSDDPNYVAKIRNKKYNVVPRIGETVIFRAVDKSERWGIVRAIQHVYNETNFDWDTVKVYLEQTRNSEENVEELKQEQEQEQEQDGKQDD